MFPCLFDLDIGRIKSLPPDFAESCAGNGCRKQGLDLLSLDSISLSFIFFVSLVEERIDFNRALSSRKRIRAGAYSAVILERSIPADLCQHAGIKCVARGGGWRKS